VTPRRRPRGRSSGRLHVVLLAGGSGTRFWPLSRKARPKQFLALTGADSLLRATWARARRLAPADRIWVVAPKALASSVRRELPRLASKRLVLEPSPRDTAPAIALACEAVARVEPGAVVAVLPTDHLIADTGAFVRAVGAARRAALRGALVCLGVRPVRPATGFGYLEVAGPPRGLTARPVVRFEEKPPLRRAQRFLRSGRHLWNAGMFVWRVDRFREELARVAPRLDRALRDGAWTRAPKLSVDFAVMEHARGVEVVPLQAGWDDLGSWDAAAAHVVTSRRPAAGRALLIGSPGSAVFGRERFVVVLDVPGVVVVDGGDALLVASRASAERLKEVVAAVRRARRPDLL